MCLTAQSHPITTPHRDTWATPTTTLPFNRNNNPIGTHIYAGAEACDPNWYRPVHIWKSWRTSSSLTGAGSRSHLGALPVLRDVGGGGGALLPSFSPQAWKRMGRWRKLLGVMSSKMHEAQGCLAKKGMRPGYQTELCSLTMWLKKTTIFKKIIIRQAW